MEQQRKKVCVVVGTRPEAIKMAPVALRLARSPKLECFLLATGQHVQMLHQALEHFNLRADVDLNVMRERQSLDYLTSAVLEGVGQALDRHSPDDDLCRFPGGLLSENSRGACGSRPEEPKRPFAFPGRDEPAPDRPACVPLVRAN
jgi:hypothetical protein